MSSVENWATASRILVILAHPDDPEFFIGGSIARWSAQGHDVSYVLLTKGERGVSLQFPECGPLAQERIVEQVKAAAVLGVNKVEFLEYEDGYLVSDLATRKEITRIIRRQKPDIIVSCDPQNYYIGDTYLNHPDHRAAGQIVVDAVFPAAGNHSFFPELMTEGYPPHSIKELWLSLPATPNLELDVSEFWELRAQALLEHKSQIGEPQAFLEHLQARRDENSADGESYIERYRRIIFRR